MLFSKFPRISIITCGLVFASVLLLWHSAYSTENEAIEDEERALLNETGKAAPPNGSPEKKLSDDLLEETLTLRNVREVWARGEYIPRKFTPDGRELLLTKPDYNGLYLLRVDRNMIRELTSLENSGVMPRFVEPSNSVVFFSQHKTQVFAFEASYRGIVKEIDTQSYFPKLADGSYLQIRRGRLTMIDGLKQRVISGYETRVFHFEITPDKKTVYFSAADDFIYQYHLESDLVVPVVRGRRSFIDPKEGAYFIYEYHESHGADTAASELYVYDIERNKRYPLTSTRDINEEFPVISPDGMKIAFSHKGKIYMADLVAKLSGSK